MLVVEGLVKKYGYFRAVEGIGFTLREGEVLGLVGPNGAGKTTTIKSIVGLVRPTGGRVEVDGRDPRRDPSARRLLGYAPEAPEAPKWARVCDFMESLAEIDGFRGSERRRVAREALEAMGVEGLCARKLGSLSKGQRKRVLIAQALLPGRKYYLFDEPFTGLDPEWVAAVRDLVVNLARGGGGVLVSSHILRELQDIVNRVVVVARGRVVFEGTLRELAEAAGVGAVVVVRVRDAHRLAEALRERGLKRVRVVAGAVHVELDDGGDPGEVLSLVRELGFTVEGFEYREVSLEDAYLRLVGGEGGAR